MRIVQVNPDYYPVPPANYGGIERVVYELTEELVRRGHEVYLYAPQGSKTSAKLIPYKHDPGQPEKIAQYVMEKLPDGIELIHDHTHDSVLGLRNLSIPTVCTIHDQRNNHIKYPVYLCQRALEVIGGNQGFFAYNGLNPEEFEFSDQKEDYLLFMGVLGWHKGIHLALEIAEKTQEKLIIAGPVFHYEFFTKEIRPHIQNNPNIKYIGEVGGKVRRHVLKHAKCLLFPSLWEEPFGLVMVEAMACGTPVIALGNGAVPEVMKGFPHFICQSVEEMVEKVRSESFPDSKQLRDYVEHHFTTSHMAAKYIEIYNQVLGKRESK
jgi:glycosyltransferase involved in cell wall biosynthesis